MFLNSLLQRKLRTVQRTQEMNQNQKSLEDDHNCKPYDDEFQIDLTLQEASSCSKEDNAGSAVSTGEVKLTVDDATQGTSNPPDSVTPNKQESPPPQTSHQQEEVQEEEEQQQQQQQHQRQHQQQQQQQQRRLQDTFDSPQDPTDHIPKQQVGF